MLIQHGAWSIADVVRPMCTAWCVLGNACWAQQPGVFGRSSGERWGPIVGAAIGSYFGPWVAYDLYQDGRVSSVL